MLTAPRPAVARRRNGSYTDSVMTGSPENELCLMVFDKPARYRGSLSIYAANLDRVDGRLFDIGPSHDRQITKKHRTVSGYREDLRNSNGRVDRGGAVASGE